MYNWEFDALALRKAMKQSALENEMTEAELCIAIGLSSSYISTLDKKTHKTVGGAVFLRICNALELDPRHFFKVVATPGTRRQEHPHSRPAIDDLPF